MHANQILSSSLCHVAEPQILCVHCQPQQSSMHKNERHTLGLMVVMTGGQGTTGVQLVHVVVGQRVHHNSCVELANVFMNEYRRFAGTMPVTPAQRRSHRGAVPQIQAHALCHVHPHYNLEQTHIQARKPKTTGAMTHAFVSRPGSIQRRGCHNSPGPQAPPGSAVCAAHRACSFAFRNGEENVSVKFSS